MTKLFAKTKHRINRYIRIREYDLLKIYEILTGTNYKGEYEDAYAVVLMFTILMVDMYCGDHNISLTKQDIYDLSVEIKRIFETEDGSISVYSIENWTVAMFEYMKKENKDYYDIHSMSTIVLRNEVSKYLQTQID